MDVIQLRPENEINQLNRLLQGIDKKRHTRQTLWLKISFGLLTVAMLSGFLLIHYKIETLESMTQSWAQPHGDRIYIYATIKVK